MKRLSIAVTAALVVGACSGGPPPVPTSPTQTRPPDPTYTLSGVIVADTPTGDAPVEGVQVTVAGQRGTSDGNGDYSISGVPKSYGGVGALKAGYAAIRGILTISGDTRLDFQLGPRIAIYTLSGVVSEVTPTGLVPVESALVDEYSCEDVSPSPPFWPSACPVTIYQITKTDRQGFYSVSGLYSGKGNTIGARKEGFEDPFEGQPEGPEVVPNDQAVTIDGNTRLDIQLVRR